MTVGSLTVTGAVSGGATGARTFGPFTITFSAAVDETLVQAVTSGDNTISVPTGATVAVIVGPNGVIPTPNPAYAGVIKVTPAAATVGISISPQYPFVWPFGSGVTSFCINVTVSTTVEIWFA